MTTDKVMLVPGVLAPALLTGRPELVRPAFRSATEKLDVEQMGEFLEAVVRDILRERANLQQLAEPVRMAAQNVRGSLMALERLEEGLHLMARGASSEDVAAAIRNPNRTD